MAGTRSQSRGESASHSPQSSQTSPAAGSKRKAPSNASSPQAKSKKQQKTLEETVGDEPKAEEHAEQDAKQEEKSHETNGNEANGNNAENEGVKQNGGVKPDDVIEEDSARAKAMSSNVFEKGIIYFFSRGRVGVDSPSSVQDIARSYIVLRPLPDGAKLNAGPLPDTSNNRLLALPKKVLPKSHRDAFMTFVEKASTTVAELKEEFLKGSSYETKTTGVSHSPPVTPLGEGVYAITHTGSRSSHLAYVLTVPEKLGEVQKQMGLQDRGSFILSTKNPEFPGPANAALDKKPGWPKEVQEEFRGRRWAPLDPKHLDYENAQLLLIGEARGELGKAVEAEEKDEQSEEKETPEDQVEKLEMEDLKRVESLNHEDAVFADLGISKKEYPELKTTW